MSEEEEIGNYFLTPRGLGTLVSLEEGYSTVAFVDIAGSAVSEGTFATSQVKRPNWNMLLEARVWLQDPSSTYGYRPGYLKGVHQDKLIIKLSGTERDDFEHVVEGEAIFRWDRELEKCEEALAVGMTDSQRFYQAKMPFIENLIEQRNNCRGFTAALSAPIRIYPHQLNVMARVLGDPIPRFVLADEVGLGKTIEAGLIIRQLLLDDPAIKVVVSVPRLLKQQWIDELQEKFLLSEQILNHNLEICSHEEITEIDPSVPYMLVIDEAHQLSESILEGDENGLIIRSLCEEIPGLLLLTATPLRGNAETFFALLHLIDPLVFSMGNLEVFGEHLQKREDNANAIESLDPNMPLDILSGAIDEIKTMYPEDKYLSEIEPEILAGQSEEKFAESLTSLKDYLRETYRLSRRVIRNRRSEVIEQGFRVSGRSFKLEEIEEPSREVMDNFLERWRLALQERDEQEEAVKLFRIGLEHALAGPEALLAFATQQLDLTNQLHEKDLLEQLKASLANKLAERNGGVSKRWEYVLEECVSVCQRAKSGCVVFTSSTENAKTFMEFLKKRVGPNPVAHHLSDDSPEEQDLAVKEFLHGSKCRVLVCDDSAEEGRNFQNSESVFHLDLPLSINRLEQRIGRTDRFREAGSASTISVLFNEPESLWVCNYVTLLSEAIGIFEDSVATLHHPLADLENELEKESFANGAMGLDREVEVLKEDLRDERDLIDFLEYIESSSSHSDISALDVLDFQEFEESWGGVSEAFDSLTSYDAGLELRKKEDIDRPGVFQYQPVDHRALRVPKVRLDKLIPIGSEFVHKRTFNRAVARKNSQARLMRLGDPLVDWMENYLRIDDRGRARVLWGHQPRLQKAFVDFRFDFQVEFDDSVMVDEGFGRLRRRGDLFLPPRVMSIWATNTAVAEGEIEDKLFKRNTDSWQNIRSERWRFVLREFPKWEQICRDAGNLARERVLQKPEMEEIISEALRRIRLDTARRKEILVVRRDRAEESVKEIAQQELDKELVILKAIQEGITNPSVRMIAAGAFVQSPMEIPKN